LDDPFQRTVDIKIYLFVIGQSISKVVKSTANSLSFSFDSCVQNSQVQERSTPKWTIQEAGISPRSQCSIKVRLSFYRKNLFSCHKNIFRATKKKVRLEKNAVRKENLNNESVCELSLFNAHFTSATHPFLLGMFQNNPILSES